MQNELTDQNQRSTRASLIVDWLLQQGLDGISQHELLQGYCQKLVDCGIPLMRLHVAQRAFHPLYGGIGFDWLRKSGASQERYEHSASPVTRWIQSPLYFMLETNTFEFRQKLLDIEEDTPYPLLLELKQAGGTDYFAIALLFEKWDIEEKVDPNAPPEGALISWSSDAEFGFSDYDLRTIRQSLPALGLALKSASDRQMATDLLGVYLGADAGNRVLSGEVQRGSLQQITAVICYFDLTGFTSLTEETPGPALIAMLNDYFGVVVSLIEANGGNVLKFMGDGLLAIFDQEDLQLATQSALNSATEIRSQLRKSNIKRNSQGLPFTDFTLALHLGEVFYGNIGSETRLDFTVIGPAVNLTARISGMHKSVGRRIIVSDAVVQASISKDHDLVSLGRYMLRGVSKPLELFTIYDVENSEL
ncbi:MAG: adenylate/guanylate cyclase domain-containing protein [Rhodobacteraceae bacterium]|nr:adenylate/guanylate cyclase domain-containing protein [Paracoccaceae bacterium]